MFWNQKKMKRKMNSKFTLKEVLNKSAEKYSKNLALTSIGSSAQATDVEKFLQEAKFSWGLTETFQLVMGTDSAKVRFHSSDLCVMGNDGYLFKGMLQKCNN